MKYIQRKGLDLSVFSLGTVQLGMDYGLGDFTAKPKKEYAFSLLDRAVEQGVNTLDTANSYGESETVIGEWLRTVDEKKRPMIVTKISSFDHSDPAKCRQDMLDQTKKCMETLGVDVIDILMIHHYEDYEQSPEVVRATMQELKDMGWIRYSGISVYSRHDYKYVAESGFDAVQIPLNLFDWGQIESGGIQAMADAGMMIFARSVFLQGLVFMRPEKVDPRMDFCLPYLHKFLEFCKEFQMSPSVLATSFALSVPGITTVVLGCQTLEQLDSNCEMMDQVRTLTPEQMAKIREAFVDIDPRVINPAVWFNHT